MAGGEELLIADSADRDREGLRGMFNQAGFVCTAVKDMATAQNLVSNKFFPVAIVDMDFDSTNGGLDLVRFIREKSKPTKVLLLAGRRSFESAVEALRLDVVDVIDKRPDEIHRLQSSVNVAIDLYRVGDKEGGILNEVRGVLEEAVKIMIGMAKKVYKGSDASIPSLSMQPTILLIDEDQGFLQQMANLIKDKPWEVSVELSGSSGLDKATTFAFQIVAVRERLVDLPGNMLIRSAQAQQTKTLGLVYGGAPQGLIERYEEGRKVTEYPFRSPADLMVVFERLVDELNAMREERRYVEAFRSQHGQFLKRFAELKVRIDSLNE